MITPGRKTRVIFDVPDTALVSPAWGIKRRGGEIAQKAAAGQIDTRLSSGVKLWSTGCWTLAPLQVEVSNITEYAIGLTLVQPVPGNTVIPALLNVAYTAMENQYRYNSDLPGLPASAAILPTGAPYFVKQIPAGASWDMSIPSGTPGLLSGNPQPPVTPLDRVGESNSTYPENQAWFLSWNPSGHSLSYPEYTFAFYFGQYGIALTGSGKAELYEYVQYQFDGSRGWIKRKEWKYARTGQVSDTSHSMAIWPHKGPNGEGYIAFTNGQVDFAEVGASASLSGAKTTAPGDAVYKQLRGDPRFIDYPVGTVTAAGGFKFDIRRDLAMKLQVSTLGFPTSGYLIDDPALVPNQNTSVPINAYADAQAPAGTTLTATLLDALTGNVYDPTLHTDVVARFDFTGDGSTTPILWGYSMNRIAYIDINAPGQFTGGNLKSVNIAGYSGDPTQETGTVVIDDVRGELGKLLNRGQLAVRVEVDHVENGLTYTTPIFTGYVNRPEAVRKVKTGYVYPSPNRHIFTLPLMGQWMRLTEAVSHNPNYFNFGDNSTNPADAQYSSSVTGGVKIPWKATDAIIWLLGAAGMTQSQINIPDLPLRLWPGNSDKKDEWVVEPLVDYAEMAQRIARNFLGQYLCYDTVPGQWTLLTGAAPNALPLYNFYTYTANQANGVNYYPGNYGYPAGSTFITEFRVTNTPPEFNCVHVICRRPQTSPQTSEVFERWLYNYNSFAVPGSGNRPDPQHPDYIGRLRELVVADDSLFGYTDEETHAAVFWTAQRYFDFCCHAQKLAHFESPLPFVIDPVNGQYRLPRFLDPITINGQPWVVKCCAPHYGLDGKQMATWEVIQPAAGQYIPPGIEEISFLRVGTARYGQKAAGAAMQGARFGMSTPSPQGEGRYRNLPRNINGYGPVQNNAGQFAFMLGYSQLGGDGYLH